MPLFPKRNVFNPSIKTSKTSKTSSKLPHSNMITFQKNFTQTPFFNRLHSMSMLNPEYLKKEKIDLWKNSEAISGEITIFHPTYLYPCYMATETNFAIENCYSTAQFAGDEAELYSPPKFHLFQKPPAQQHLPFWDFQSEKIDLNAFLTRRIIYNKSDKTNDALWSLTLGFNPPYKANHLLQQEYLTGQIVVSSGRTAAEFRQDLKNIYNKNNCGKDFFKKNTFFVVDTNNVFGQWLGIEQEIIKIADNKFSYQYPAKIPQLLLRCNSDCNQRLTITDINELYESNEWKNYKKR